MFKKFFSYTSAEGLSKGLNWITIAMLPVFLSPQQYGIVGLLVAIEGIVSNITLIGQEKAIFRFYDSKDFNILNYSFRLITSFIFLLLVILFITVLFKQSLFDIQIFPHLFVFLLSILLYNQARLLMSYSRISENPAMFWKTRALYQVIKFISVFALCFVFKKGICYVYGCFFTGLVFFIFYFKQIYNTHKSGGKFLLFDKHLLLLLGFGVPLIFHALSGNILSYADRFFINGLLSAQQLGIYTFVYSLGSSIFFFYGTVASYFEPLTYRYHNNKQAYQAVLKFYLVFVLSCASIMAFAIKLSFIPVILKFVSKEYIQGAGCLTWILAAHLLIPFYTIANFELAVIGKTKFIAVSTVCSALVNLILNYWLIPQTGILGAAIATFLTYLSLSLLTNYWSTKKAGFNFNYIKFICVIFLLINAYNYCLVYVQNNTGEIAAAVITFVVLFLITYFLYKKLVLLILP